MRQIDRIKLFIPIILAVFLVSACHAQKKPKERGPKAPDFTLEDLNGTVVHLSDFKGKVVLLNFFGTYCPPCRMEIPGFVRLQKEFGPKGFQVIGVSVDQNPLLVLPRFIGIYHINYPILCATDKVLRDYGNIYAIPVTVLISRDGIVLKRYVGMVTENTLIPEIKKALKEH